MILELPYLEYEQPIGVFYMTVISADNLIRIVDIRRRGEKKNEGLLLWNDNLADNAEGVQRQESLERVNKISKFCEDPDATFPTPIIVSVYQHVKVEGEGRVFRFCIDEGERIGDVIDGQHRLMGIAKSGYANRFMLPVALMFNMNVEEKAYVFSIINSTQTKVSMSLIYDLFDLSTKRSPQKTAHEIARSLNKMEKSPFYNRLKMLGRKESGQDYATLSQGSFVKQFLTLVSKDPDEDSSRIKRGLRLQDYNLPFRQYFIEERDDVILKILMNCFTALKEEFLDEWKDPSRNVLWKTTGYGAIIKAFPYLYKSGIDTKDLSQDYFRKCFFNLRVFMEKKNEDFSNRFFSGGGEQLQQKLAGYIQKAQEVANEDH